MLNIRDLLNGPLNDYACRPVHAIRFTNDQIREVARANGETLTDEQCNEIADGLYWWFYEQFHDRVNDMYDCIKED